MIDVEMFKFKWTKIIFLSLLQLMRQNSMKINRVLFSIDFKINKYMMMMLTLARKKNINLWASRNYNRLKIRTISTNSSRFKITEWECLQAAKAYWEKSKWQAHHVIKWTYHPLSKTWYRYREVLHSLRIREIWHLKILSNLYKLSKWF